MKKKTGITLFTGGGGVELGLQHLVDFIGGVELDPSIAAHATSQLGHEVTVGDATQIDYRSWKGVDYLHASPPCTRASAANQKAGETELDIALASAVIRALGETKATVFTLENVIGYKKFKAFQMILDYLDSAGWGYHYDTYNAADYGVPQRRVRLLLRAKLWHENEDIPRVYPTHRNPSKPFTPSLFGDDLPPWVGWYEAIEDLLPTCPESKLAEWQIKRLPISFLSSFLIGGANTSDTQAAPGVGVSMKDEVGLCVNAHNPTSWRCVLVRSQGEGSEVCVPQTSPSPTLTTDTGNKTRAILVNGIPRNHAGDIDAKVMEEQGSSITATIPNHPMKAIQENRIVRLTPRCIARLQSFPDSYELPQSSKLACKIVGNAVPPLLANKVFSSVLIQ